VVQVHVVFSVVARWASSVASGLDTDPFVARWAHFGERCFCGGEELDCPGDVLFVLTAAGGVDGGFPVGFAANLVKIEYVFFPLCAEFIRYYLHFLFSHAQTVPHAKMAVKRKMIDYSILLSTELLG
jgi:hypothetical protein